MVIIGFATTNISMPKGHHILLKHIVVIGAPLDIHIKVEPQVMHDGVRKIFEYYKTGKIRPHIMKTVPFDDIVAAQQSIRNREVQGKIVVTIGRG